MTSSSRGTLLCDISFAGDSFSGGSHINNDQQFTTKDRDNDNRAANCAIEMGAVGAWWFNACYSSALNGNFGPSSAGGKIMWETWKGYYESLKKVSMKMRKK